MLRTHALNGAQHAANGLTVLVEAMRYGYQTGKDRVSFAEATGVRHVEESGSGRVRIQDATVAGGQASGARTTP